MYDLKDPFYKIKGTFKIESDHIGHQLETATQNLKRNLESYCVTRGCLCTYTLQTYAGHKITSSVLCFGS